MSDYLNDPEAVKDFYPRYKLLYISVGVTFAIFFLRLWFLQVMQGTELREFSERNRLKHEKIVAPRGIMFDRNGQILVDNLPGFDVTVTPQYANNLDELAEDLSKIFKLNPKSIINDIKKSRFQNGTFRPVRVAENISRDDVIKVEKLRLVHPGLEVKVSIKRSYLDGQIGAQLFGYVSEISKEELPRLNTNRKPDDRFEQGDLVGKSGLEQVYDDKVRGLDGASFVQVDAHGREIATQASSILSGFTRTQDPSPGNSMMLTIDKDVQEAAWNALAGTGRIGAVVALDPHNGEILSWVVAPSYDPGEFSTGISSKLWSKLINDPYKPLRNKVVQDHNAPGSTFKAIVALAALQEGIVTPTTTHFCPGFIKFGRKIYHCHLKQGHGAVNITMALERSCNVFFYKMGMALGIDRISKYARALGLGQKTDIMVPNEVPGLIPNSDWKLKALGEEWQPGENLSNAIGQGFVLATPIQMAMAYSGIAMSGPVYQPHVLRKIVDVEGKVLQEIQPKLKFDPSTGENTNSVIIDKKNYALVREGLRLVSNGASGTARGQKIAGLEIAGKSGTSQLFNLNTDQVYAKCANRPMEQRHHGWFVGYAPADDPKIVVAVLAEHSCSGSGGAAPVVKDVIKTYMMKYHPELIKGKEIIKITPPPGTDIED